MASDIRDTHESAYAGARVAQGSGLLSSFFIQVIRLGWFSEAWTDESICLASLALFCLVAEVWYGLLDSCSSDKFS